MTPGPLQDCVEIIGKIVRSHLRTADDAYLQKMPVVQQHLQDAEGAQPVAGVQLYGFQLILGFEG